MNIRLVALAAAASVVAGGATVPASSARVAFLSCGSVKGGGATWSVVAAGGVSCKAGKQLVKKLSAKPHPSIETKLGTYIGLKCIEIAGKGKREIACLSTDGRRSVYGVTPAKSK